MFYGVRGQEEEGDEEGGAAGGDANLNGAMAVGVGVGVAGGVLSSTLHKAPKDAELGGKTSHSLDKPSKSQARERVADAMTAGSERTVGSERRLREAVDVATYDKEYPPVNVMLKLLLDYKEAGEVGSIQRAGFQHLLLQVIFALVVWEKVHTRRNKQGLVSQIESSSHA